MLLLLLRYLYLNMRAKEVFIFILLGSQCRSAALAPHPHTASTVPGPLDASEALWSSRVPSHARRPASESRAVLAWRRAAATASRLVRLPDCLLPFGPAWVRIQSQLLQLLPPGETSKRRTPAREQRKARK